MSGLLWTFAPFWFSSRSPENLKIFVPAGIVTGVLVSLMLYKPILTSNRPTTLLLGISALPLGAFCFGLCVGLFETIIGGPGGDGVSRSHDLLAAPYLAVTYMYMSIAVCLKPLYALILVGSSVLTTWLLRLILLHQRNSSQPS
jgi:hypothetical protein